MTSTELTVEMIKTHEKLFREVLKDVKESKRGVYMPKSITSDLSLEELLSFVPSDTRMSPKGRNESFKIDVFSVGPTNQYFAKDVQNNEIVFGYSNSAFLSGGGFVLLYDLSEKIPRYKEILLHTMS